MPPGRRTEDQMSADHDLLIEIRTKLDGLMSLVAGKAEAEQVSDHEKRIRAMEAWVWRAIGALTVLQAAVGLYVAFVIKGGH